MFDADGVLVDSERLSIAIEASILAELGWPLGEAEIVDRFVGRSAAYMCAEVGRHIGRPVDWAAEFEPRYVEAFERELTAVPGVVDALDAVDALGFETCVASSGSHERLRLTLGITGLLARFEGRIFSADDVARAKPDPAVFLHAAATMGVEPARCAVVEDSVAGVAAARAAGMTAFGFASGVTPAHELAARGAATFDAMAALPALLAACHL